MLQAATVLAATTKVSVVGAQPAGARAPRALGYLPWWMAAGWESAPLKSIDRLVLFEASVQRDGRLSEHNWATRATPVVAYAAQRGLPIEIAITLHGHGEFNAVFGSGSARARLLTACERWLEVGWIAGLHLDFEGFHAAHEGAVARFREWLADIDELRRGMRKGLSAFFAANDAFAPFDSETAGRVDYWVAQLYDAHWKESSQTGPLVTRLQDNPVAVQRALSRFAALGISSNAILLSVPLYGLEWLADSDRPGARTRGPAALLTFAETPVDLMPNDRKVATQLAAAHGLRRDGEETPYYAMREGGYWRQGWYEDLVSLTRKLAPERRSGYAGLAFFPLGYDRNEIVGGMLRWWRGGER